MAAHDDLVAMNVRLTPEARDGLRDYSARYGASLTALMEALGQWAAEHDDGRPNSTEWREIAAHARAIDKDRRTRAVG